MPVTQESIIQAAEALVARGESPTLAAVRQEVGGGSYTTISDAMREWRQSKEKERIMAEVIMIPAELQQALNEAGRSLWAVATEQHAAKLAQEREAMEEERKRYAAERQDAVELADQVEAEVGDLKLVLETERQASADLREELRETRAALDKSQTEARGLADQVEEHRQRGVVLEGHLSQTRGELAQAAEERGRLQGRLEEAEARWKSAIDAERASRVEAESAVAQIKQDLVEHRAQMQADIRMARSELDAAKSAVDAERAARLAAESAAAQLREELGELRVRIAQLTERTERIEDLRALLQDRGK